MRARLTGIALLAVAAALVTASSAAAELITLDRNPMESDAQRAEPVKLFGASCAPGGSDHAFRVKVGKGTRECTYRSPVIGRDLQIAATERLLSNTPKALQRKAFLGVTLRAGGGSRYDLLVFPLQRKAQLRKTFTDGSTKFVRIAKDVRSIKPLNQANQLRLRAFNVTEGPDKGDCRVLGYVGNVLVADFTDGAAGDLQGRASGFTIGATSNAKGLVASVDDVIVRAPNPF